MEGVMCVKDKWVWELNSAWLKTCIEILYHMEITQDKIDRRRSASTRLKMGRRTCIWRFASSNVDTSPPFSPRWTGFCGWKRRLPWKGQPVVWPPNGGSPTQRRVDMSRVRLPSPWCAPLIAVYVDPGCLHTGSACSDPSGRMGRGSTSFGKDPR